VEGTDGSFKYEYAYPCCPATVLELERGLRDYFGFYNERRVHQSLEYRTPADVHRQESRRRLEK
jgi:putative transposase